MAKPYRRRKGKNGPLVGNFRVTIDGRDLNLGTKDAREATHRARLAADGKWPPEEAAARTLLSTVDPGATPGAQPLITPPPEPATPPSPDPVPPPGAPAESPIVPPPGDPGIADAPGAQPTEPLESAFAGAAADAAGTTEDVSTDKAARERASEQELAGLMRELNNGAGQSEIVDNLADGIAAGILWMERKSIELGWGWTFKRRTGRVLVTHPHNPEGIERKCIKVGMKAVLTVHFPELANKLTPGWAIAIGCVMGAGVAAATADLVDPTTGKSASVADTMAAAGQPMPPMPGTAPAVA